MPTTIPQVASAMRTILTTVARHAGRTTGFVQRPATTICDGAVLAQILAFTLLANPTPALSDYCQTAAALGVTISPQGLDQRFTETAAHCLHQVLSAALQRVVTADPVAIPLLQRFPGGVFLRDSTTIPLPSTFASLWRGCGMQAAAIKLHLQLDLLRGQIRGDLQHGRAADQATDFDDHLPVGAMRIADLGYWNLGQFAALSDRGCWWLSRMHQQTTVQTADGRWWTLAALLTHHGQDTPLDCPVHLGKQARVAARLLAVAVPQEVADQRRRRLRATARRKGRMVCADQLALAAWTILVTNVPGSHLTIAEALVLGRLRWQIELVFKCWKSHGQVDLVRPVQPWRVLCELYGRLLAMVIQQWVLLCGSWATPDRSRMQAAQTVRTHALSLAHASASTARLATALAAIARCLARGGRLNRRKKHPNAIQWAFDPLLGSLA